MIYQKKIYVLLLINFTFIEKCEIIQNYIILIQLLIKRKSYYCLYILLIKFYK